MGKVKQGAARSRLRDTSSKNTSSTLLSREFSACQPASNFLDVCTATSKESGFGAFASSQSPDTAPPTDCKPDCNTYATHSAVTAKPHVPRVKKCEKLKRRRLALVQKLDSMAQKMRLVRAERKRRRTPVVGDMRPLAASLPELLQQLKPTPAAVGDRKLIAGDVGSERAAPLLSVAGRKGTPKKRVRNKQFLQDIAQFRRAVDHPSFRSDPQAVVVEHVQQWVLRESQRTPRRPAP